MSCTQRSEAVGYGSALRGGSSLVVGELELEMLRRQVGDDGAAPAELGGQGVTLDRLGFSCYDKGA